MNLRNSIPFVQNSVKTNKSDMKKSLVLLVVQVYEFVPIQSLFVQNSIEANEFEFLKYLF